jgi:hypothetical protein
VRARAGDAGVFPGGGNAGCGGFEPDRGRVCEWRSPADHGTADPATVSAIIKALAKDAGRDDPPPEPA